MRLLLLVACLTSSTAAAFAENDSGTEKERKLFWDSGIRYTTPNLKLKIGGQAHLDTAGFAGGAEDLDLESAVTWRRARISTDIRLRKRLRFKLKWALDGQPPRLKDAWMQVDFPKLTTSVRGGRFSSTFGLEKETGSDHLMFLEEGLPAAFVPRQETGLLIHSQSSRRRWDLGFSSGAKEYECLVCDVLGVTGRYSTGLELGSKERVLHLGADFARRWLGSGENARIRARPESFLAPVLVDTGEIDADRSDAALLETALISGPYSLQSEWGWAWVKRSSGDVVGFSAFYLYGSYSLTGETRPYDEQRGIPGRVQPRREFRDGKGGTGAFVIAARYSQIDLDDRDVDGGRLRDVSFAFNWYPTPNAAAMFNVVRAKRSALEPVWIFQLRLLLAY